MNAKKILVVTTGGTIESFYDKEGPTPYVVPQNKTSIIPEALERLGLKDQCDIYPLCIKDSKQVHTPELQHIAQYIAEHDQEYDGIVITHGTDTMPVHARKLKALLAEYEIKPKTVVFTGSMSPLRDAQKQWREDSDGWENLRASIASAQSTAPGAYIVMEGNTQDAETLDKRVKTNPDNTVQSATFFSRDPGQSEIIIR